MSATHPTPLQRVFHIPHGGMNIPVTGPQQCNAYVFDESKFVDQPRPPSLPDVLPPGGKWPPEQLSDLLYFYPCVFQFECLGEACYTRPGCNDEACTHTLEAWEEATNGWQDHFELRLKPRRIVGVFTRKTFSRGEVLRWYTGELLAQKPVEKCGRRYFEIPIGIVEGEDHDEKCYAVIDASRKGNWTRFISHESDDPDLKFWLARIGKVRIVVVVARRDIPSGVELTINYRGRDTLWKAVKASHPTVLTNCKRSKNDEVKIEGASRV